MDLFTLKGSFFAEFKPVLKLKKEGGWAFQGSVLSDYITVFDFFPDSFATSTIPFSSRKMFVFNVQAEGERYYR